MIINCDAYNIYLLNMYVNYIYVVHFVLLCVCNVVELGMNMNYRLAIGTIFKFYVSYLTYIYVVKSIQFEHIHNFVIMYNDPPIKKEMVGIEIVTTASQTVIKYSDNA